MKSHVIIYGSDAEEEEEECASLVMRDCMVHVCASMQRTCVSI